MKKTKKVKEIKLPMEFIPGKMKYEPILPAIKTNKKINVKLSWKWLMWLIIGIIILLGFILILLKYYNPKIWQ